ncbi:cupin domain-containing protein [Bacteroides thetaiotaomicron]|uniref:cupin domain-containing protein n=1 Tax=Bacteroides thetaiotaomicron TaxID=818 RepID=UPI001F1B0A7C|nr:cupin domain-containing protein [Bacteroides thetaiotaomicron]MCE8780849.1 cupin domain-containing protein [Bacteroides thetaiotaomicron]
MKKHVLDVNSLVELVHNDHGLVTGFSLRSFKMETAVMDHHSNHYYIVYLLEGSIDVSCSLYSKQLVREGEIAFIPKDSAYTIKSHTKRSKALFFAFDTTMIKMDTPLFNYFVKNVSKKPYEFNTLPINEQMRKVLDMILSQITHSKKVKIPQVCTSWNMTIFVTFASFYKRNELLDFFRPIMSTTTDFRSFVENNFLEAEGNVSKLRKLSGLSRHIFEKNFKDIFGSAPKEWFHEQLRKRITSLAKKKDIRPKELARELHVNIHRLAQITRLQFDCTPSELIERVQSEEEIDV